MDEKDRPLPQPSRRPFGRPRPGEQRDGQPLMADALAMAAAEGRLDEFMQREMPDNEYARNLVSMMMGMTGMAPPAAAGEPSPAREEAAAQGTDETPKPPEDVIRAVGAGDVAGLTEILKKEHAKRSGSPVMESAAPAQGAGPAAAEQETIDRMVAIAAENGLTVDWVVLRALKLYVEEYQKTGRL